jgi:hypothetical protein
MAYKEINDPTPSLLELGILVAKLEHFVKAILFLSACNMIMNAAMILAALGATLL